MEITYPIAIRVDFETLRLTDGTCTLYWLMAITIHLLKCISPYLHVVEQNGLRCTHKRSIPARNHQRLALANVRAKLLLQHCRCCSGLIEKVHLQVEG